MSYNLSFRVASYGTALVTHVLVFRANQEPDRNSIKGRASQNSYSTFNLQRVTMSANKDVSSATQANPNFDSQDLDDFLLKIQIPSNGQGDYNVAPDTVSVAAPADDLDDLLDSIINTVPPTLEVSHDYENILKNLVEKMIILTDIEETQEQLASASAYFLEMLNENSQTDYDYDYLYDCVYIVNDFFNLCEGNALKDKHLDRGVRLLYTQAGHFNHIEYELKLEFSHVVDDHSLYNFTHKFKKGPEFTFDHRKAIEEFYRLPKEQPLIQLHLDCFEKGLVYNEDKAAPTPKQPKVPMHLLYPGCLLYTSPSPRDRG